MPAMFFCVQRVHRFGAQAGNTLVMAHDDWAFSSSSGVINVRAGGATGRRLQSAHYQDVTHAYKMPYGFLSGMNVMVM